MFISYPSVQKGYMIYDTTSKEMFVSKDVVFFENEFPFKRNESQERKQGDQPMMWEDEVKPVHLHHQEIIKSYRKLI